MMGSSWIVALLLMGNCVSILQEWSIQLLPIDAPNFKVALFDVFGTRQWLPLLLFLLFSSFWASSFFCLFIGQPNSRKRRIWQSIVVIAVVIYAPGLATLLLHDVINESMFSKFIFLIFISVPLTLAIGIWIVLFVADGVETVTREAELGLRRAKEILKDIEIRGTEDVLDLGTINRTIQICDESLRELDQNFVMDRGFLYSVGAMHRYPRLSVILSESTLLLHDTMDHEISALKGKIRDELAEINGSVFGTRARKALIKQLPKPKSTWVESLIALTGDQNSDH